MRKALLDSFDEGIFRMDSPKKSMGVQFRVGLDNGKVVSAGNYSSLIAGLPDLVAMEYVFVEPSKHKIVKEWLDRSLPEILSQSEEDVVEIDEEGD